VKESIQSLNFCKKHNFKQVESFLEIHYSNDFFSRFNIELPYDITPLSLISTIDEESFELLKKEFPPERTYRISVFEKNLSNLKELE
jgi:hypothetical protein